MHEGGESGNGLRSRTNSTQRLVATELLSIRSMFAQQFHPSCICVYSRLLHFLLLNCKLIAPGTHNRSSCHEACEASS